MMTSSWDLRPSGFFAIDRLFALPAFEFSQWEENFVEAMREAFKWHYENNPIFRGHAELSRFGAQDIQSLEDVERIPWIFVQNFKETRFLSLPLEDIVLTLTSSGTRGLKTQLFLDDTSLNRLRVAAHGVYEALGILKKPDQCHYQLYTYDIEQAPNLGTAWTDVLIAEMAPGGEMVFLIRKKSSQGDFEFDLEFALETYLQFAESGRPVRFLGFPAFMHHAFLEIKKRGFPKLKAPNKSWILTGGGWKTHQGKIVSKREFAECAFETTGVPIENTRDLFGMAEHGVGYVDCEKGRLHIPAYAHARSRDPFTLKLLPYGKPGLLQLFSPLQKGYPSISLLTTDEAVIHDAPCECGRPGRTLEYVGRMGLTQHEGCALKALEYLKV